MGGIYKVDADGRSSMTYPIGFTMFSVTDDEDAIDLARNYVKEMCFTSDDVRIRKIDELMCVLTKREITFYGKTGD